MASDDGSSDDGPVRQTCPVFRPKARPSPVTSVAAVAAKRARRIEMEVDGYSEWQMNRAEAQRVVNGVADTEGVVQVYIDVQTLELKSSSLNLLPRRWSRLGL